MWHVNILMNSRYWIQQCLCPEPGLLQTEMTDVSEEEKINKVNSSTGTRRKDTDTGPHGAVTDPYIWSTRLPWTVAALLHKERSWAKTENTPCFCFGSVRPSWKEEEKRGLKVNRRHIQGCERTTVLMRRRSRGVKRENQSQNLAHVRQGRLPRGRKRTMRNIKSRGLKLEGGPDSVMKEQRNLWNSTPHLHVVDLGPKKSTLLFNISKNNSWNGTVIKKI